MPPRPRGTHDRGALRRAVERRSVAPAAWLQRAPRWVPPIVAVALLLTGLAAPVPVGAAALLVLATLLAWLAYLSWPVVSRFGRGQRALGTIILVARLVA